MKKTKKELGSRFSLQGFVRRKRWAHIRSASHGIILLGLLGITIFLAGCPMQPTALTLGLSLIAEGFTSPVGMAVPNDGTGRIFIIDQVGIIRIIDPNGNLLDTPFLDVTDHMVSLQLFYDERGLLSMVFHPDYVSNGRFFIFYNVPLEDDDPEEFNSRVRISEFQVSENDPNLADYESEVVLLEVVKPQFNHNGGQLAFGPDGLLYIGIGDGGGAGDVGDGHTPDLGNGQDASNLLGTILRYDASTLGELTIPASNPFVNDPEVLDPIYAYGLRNPWRFSFDRAGEQRLFCGDVGQALYEEVDIILAGGNYGWNIKEGTKCFDPENPDSSPTQCSETGARGESLIDPIMEYSHEGGEDEIIGTSVSGGFVYRGNVLTNLVGRYIFGDLSKDFSGPNGSVFVAAESGKEWQFTEVSIEFSEAGTDSQTNGRLNRFLLSFGQDAEGEIYLLTSDNVRPTGSTGQVFKIVTANPTPTTTTGQETTTTTPKPLGEG